MSDAVLSGVTALKRAQSHRRGDGQDVNKFLDEIN
jgi:hypothetical protein